MLANEHQFLHAITVLFVPVLPQLGIVRHELHQLFFRHGSKPLSCFTQIELTTGLLKEIAHIILFGKIAHTLTTDHILRPVSRYKLIKESQVKRLARVIYIGVYSELSQVIVIAMLMVMIVMMVMMLMLLLFLIVIIILVSVMVVMMAGIFYFLNPSSRSSRTVKVEKIRFQKLLQVHGAVGRFEKWSRVLNGADD